MTNLSHGATRFDQLARATTSPLGRQTFGRMFPENPLKLGELSHDMFVDCLNDLADTMQADQVMAGPANAGMTFFGQFVDHDITRDATSVLGTRIDPATIPNVRTPALDLDSVYGDGPTASPYLYGPGKAKHFLMFGRRGNPLDFARTCAGKALIGDPRNDENIILSQIHGAFICLHNILMTKSLEKSAQAQEIRDIGRAGLSRRNWNDLVTPELQGFEEVRRFIRLHYQWVVWNEFLPSFVDTESMTSIRAKPVLPDAPVMPIEFSGAAYRFGHATAQPEYQLKPGTPAHGLFQTRGFGPRPYNSNLSLNMFFDMGDGLVQKARPIGPQVAAPLFSLPFINDPVSLKDSGITLSTERARKLPLRNLLRDRYSYHLASGQMVAEQMAIEPLNPPKALHDTGLTRTPLWYYILQEAQERGRGRLTGVGGRIVSLVFDNLLEQDPTTYRHITGFSPWSGFDGKPSILSGILHFVETYRDNAAFAEDLWCG